MMRNKLILPFMLLAISACTGLKTNSGSEAEDSCSVSALSLDSVTCHRLERLTENSQTPSCQVDINVLYATGDDPVSKTVNAAIAKALFSKDSLTVETAVQAFADSLTASARHDWDEFYRMDEETFSFDYTYELTTKISEFTRQDILAYISDYYQYTGGAHGSFLQMFSNIDLKTGQILTKEEVFVEEKEKAILSLMEGQLMADNDCKTMDELREQTGLTMLGDLFIDEHNFLIVNDGITFIFNQYSIAAYACGITTIHLTYEQLEGCIKIND